MSVLRPWDLKLKLDRVPNDLPLYLQIAQMIIQEIEKGRLKPLTIMPGTRDLAYSLKVNRKTVVMTYNELIAQGWLVTENRRSTFVPEKLPVSLLKNIKRIQIPSDTEKDSPLESSKLNNTAINAPYLSLTDSSVDARLAPYEILSRSYRRALVNTARQNQMLPHDTRGDLELRKSIAEMLNMEKGFLINHNNICLVNGSQMGIFIAARVVVNHNDLVIFEHLTYHNARETFRSCGASIIDVGIDDSGILVDDIEKICQTQSIHAVYVTPQHQFPTTVRLSAERKSKLLRLANQYDFIIIEDDHDNEYNFSSSPIFPISSSDQNGKSLYIGSLTSLVSSGFNIGYIVGEESVINKCAHELSLIDAQRNTVQEICLSELMKTGELKRHTRKVTKIYQDRRDSFKSLVNNELYEWVTFNAPESGLAFWLKFKASINANELLFEAQTHGLLLDITPYAAEDITLQAIRIGFSALNHSEMKEVVKRLKSAFKNVFSRKVLD